jgi:hypothetical protein
MHDLDEDDGRPPFDERLQKIWQQDTSLAAERRLRRKKLREDQTNAGEQQLDGELLRLLGEEEEHSKR